ncbi:MAG: hypothetical protein E6123_12415, partial [Clostridiales bacterium]|nr:hypothetical protein [Clostridiales bacterium]
FFVVSVTLLADSLSVKRAIVLINDCSIFLLVYTYVKTHINKNGTRIAKKAIVVILLVLYRFILPGFLSLDIGKNISDQKG